MFVTSVVGVFNDAEKRCSPHDAVLLHAVVCNILRIVAHHSSGWVDSGVMELREEPCPAPEVAFCLAS